MTPRCDAHCRVRLRGMMHTAELDSALRCTPQIFFENCSSLDSAVWCTLQSLTLRWDAHRGACLRSVMHPLESESDSAVSPRWDAHCGAFLKIRISRWIGNRVRKYVSLFVRGLYGFQSWQKIEVENLVTHCLLSLFIRGPDGFESWKNLEVENLGTHSL